MFGKATVHDKLKRHSKSDCNHDDRDRNNNLQYQGPRDYRGFHQAILATGNRLCNVF
jgi:hypothetical protein